MPTSYFSEAEIACRCGCGTANIQPEALEKLNRVRASLGHPLYLNSACRCEAHNKAVGGSERSQHISTPARPGRAFDVSIYWKDGGKIREVAVEDLVSAAERAGFKGIGRYKTFVHMDNRKRKARW